MKTEKTKKTKQYKATAMFVLSIINAVLTAVLLITGICLLSCGNGTIKVDGKIESLVPLYTCFIVFGALGVVMSVLTIISRKLNKSFGLTLALGIVSIVTSFVSTQLAMGILTIIHATKLLAAKKKQLKKVNK